MLFSIITPVYNRADCIARCIESVARNLNTDYNIQHIVVDDGSTDNTSSIIVDYSKRYNHIEFIRMKKNSGTNAARNAAINVALGDYCILLDSDDYFVDGAIEKVYDVISRKNYKHYCFVPDDMKPFYDQIGLFDNNGERVLTFKDFLSGEFSVDYVHCIKTDVLKKYPFDENLRIYEGLFFLKIYKDVGDILISDILVSIRERSRKDSVTRNVIRTSSNIIEKNLKAACYQIEWFKSDYLHYGLGSQLNSLLAEKVENALLLSKYNLVKDDLKALSALKGKRYYLYKGICTFRCGGVFRWLLTNYLKLKYNVLKKRMRSW